MPDIVMPRLSDSMEEGTILRWLKADGDEVARGEELAEIETDKATMTYEADAAGVLEIVAEEGATLPIGDVIARLLGAGEEPGGNGAAAPAAAEPAEGREAESGGHPAAPPAVADHEAADAATPADGAAPGSGARETLADTGPAPASPAGADGERVKASPVARRVAQDRGVDLRGVTGTGPGGRIVRADVEAAPTGAAAPAAAAPATAPAPATGAVTERGTNRGDVTTTEPSRVQQVIARRMAESRATIPSFEVTTEVDMTAAVDLRTQLKAIAGDAPPPSYNDMVVKACALALREHPRVNGAYKDGAFEQYGRVNVGIAVAAPESLVVPVIFDADSRSLGEIGRETRALAAKVRENTITPPEVSGGTFTVSNLGMYGVAHFTAVINPGQAAILAVGELAARPVVRDGEIVPGHTMAMTLASDHRILYGADSALFLRRVRELLEQPLALAL
ncbi:2-oxo acid dehydrogenase subunit E2 [Svornostia abyssi]|uniref:Dihydrolipoamide acetyltransferase component of pyruvate dehydrogenase complex n=1 Tax=Svornostia abyssi TaxID=2898438 RepID=A0ABY5PK06_9ACTN|nr:2-oxo acid dehydrogenase subunit E2 [Parviterribacteraceae bacterium J379]